MSYVKTKFWQGTTSTIPVSKKGKRLYFIKYELEEWVMWGRRKTTAGLLIDAEIACSRQAEENNDHYSVETVN